MLHLGYSITTLVQSMWIHVQVCWCFSVCVAQYQCSEDSQCVDYYKVCDQHPDCPEASDEMNCTNGKTFDLTQLSHNILEI